MSGEQRPNGFANQSAGPQRNQNPYGQQANYQNPYQQGGYQGAQPNAYTQQPTPYAQQGGYVPQQNPYAQQPAPYAQQGGYIPQQNPYGQQQNPYQQANPYGQYAQQQGQTAYRQSQGQQPNPYAQNPYQAQQPNPYAQNPYQAQQPNPYAQNPYQAQQPNPYAQNPYQAQQPNPYAPVPPAGQTSMHPNGNSGKPALPVVPTAICAATLILLVAALITGASALKIAAAVIGIGGAIMPWVIRGLGNGLPRVVSSAVCGVAAILCIVLMLNGSGDPSKPNEPAPGQPQTAVTDTPSPLTEENIGNREPTLTEPPATAVPVEVEDNGLNGECGQQLSSFFYFWSVNDTENMVSLCAPSWQKNVSEPKKSLFSILANRVPVNYRFTAISGTMNDASRTITCEVEIDKRNGGATALYIFKVIMLNEDGAWFVDPRSLESNETATATATNSFATQPPTPEPATADTILYYNPNGGSYYHADQNCSLIAAKWLPLKGSFRYSEVNNSPYSELSPCNSCAAPLREQ